MPPRRASVSAAAPSPAARKRASVADVHLASEPTAAVAEAAPGKVDLSFLKRESPYETHPWTWLFHLFVSAQFGVHRLLGLAYLAQYAWAWYLYATDYAAFMRSPLPWSLPLNGVLQSLTATYYFSFLPRKADPGYYSDKSALSYDFVKENIFYSSILAWQWLYFDDRFFGATGSFAERLRSGGGAAAAAPQLAAALLAVELAWTFLPYALFRNLVPKTSFRDSLRTGGNKTKGNQLFFHYATLVTKFFYVWAKWYIGFYFNYLRFLGFVSAEQTKEMYMLLLFSAFATTISMFLHTLKFKGYIGPRTSFLVYMASYLATFISIVRLYSLFLGHLPLVAITAVGLLLNYFGDRIMCGSRAWRDLPGHSWQLATMVLLWAVREGRVALPWGLQSL